MNYQFLLDYFFLGAAGAACAEMLKLYELRGKLSSKKYQSALRSPLFWIVTLGMLVASGFIAWAVNSLTQLAPWQIVLSGIGARSLIRAPLEARTANPPARLGDSGEPQQKFHLDDLFR